MSVKSSTLFCRIAYFVSTYLLCLDTYDYVYACYINYIQTEDGATKMSNNSIGKDLTPDGKFHPWWT